MIFGLDGFVLVGAWYGFHHLLGWPTLVSWALAVLVAFVKSPHYDNLFTKREGDSS